MRQKAATQDVTETPERSPPDGAARLNRKTDQQAAKLVRTLEIHPASARMKANLQRRCRMEIRGSSESAFEIMISAEVVISELIEDGPEAFAKRVREMLEAELKPLLGIDWKKFKTPDHPTRA